MLSNYVLNAQKGDFVQIQKNTPGLSNFRQMFFQNEVEVLIFFGEMLDGRWQVISMLYVETENVFEHTRRSCAFHGR